MPGASGPRRNAAIVRNVLAPFGFGRRGRICGAVATRRWHRIAVVAGGWQLIPRRSERHYRYSRSGARVRIAAIALAVAACLAAGDLCAQAAPGSIEIGGGGGRFYGGSFARGSNREFAHRVEADDDILNGFWLGAQLSERLGLEIGVRKSKEDIVQPSSGVFPNEPTLATLELTTVEIGVVRSFPIGHFAPFVALDGGVSNLNINVPDRAVRDVNRFGISAAAGAKFYAARWVGFRVEARARATYLGRRSGGRDGGWTDGGRWFRNEEIFGGVFFAFGRKG